MRSSGSYRDELFCITMNVFFRSEGWTYITERTQEAVLYHLQGCSACKQWKGGKIQGPTEKVK